MVPLAATATVATNPTSTVLLLLIVITMCYLVACVVQPFRACRHCQGYGHLRGLLGGIRLCGRCDGTGLRLRAGRRALITVRRLYREANRTRRR